MKFPSGSWIDTGTRLTGWSNGSVIFGLGRRRGRTMSESKGKPVSLGVKVVDAVLLLVPVVVCIVIYIIVMGYGH